ncbi:MAG: calcium-binding protein [Bradyrhizobium sp.]
MKAVTAKHLTSDIGDFGSDLDASSLSAGTNFVGLTLNGGAGNDFLGGGAGDDILNGFDGDDILVGGAGADVLNGGSGNDTASYENASGGVIANLTNTANDYGDAAGDTYHGIENLRGSAFGDLLVGTDADDNVIEGGGGADVMIGGLAATLRAMNTRR